MASHQVRRRAGPGGARAPGGAGPHLGQLTLGGFGDARTTSCHQYLRAHPEQDV
ncbi:hypothetical protein ACFFX0_25125 [Citricoccus parietis]|uniref:Uncharacterized protein n=1 Tax=Citricoccus parietis TaxID=592307 RepID=A0ABV5G5S3_9MICC